MNRKLLDVLMAVLLIAGVVCTMEFGLPKAAEAAADLNAVNGTSDASDGAGGGGTGAGNGGANAVRTVVIDPGHGGIDPGKVGAGGTLEKDINLEISLRLKECLLEQGYNVVMTREDGEGLYDENDVNKKAADMKRRCGIIEESSADITVSIHQNSYTEPNVSGAQVFYYKHSSQGRKLAEIFQERLRDRLDKENRRQCKTNDNYYMLVHTPCPTVIVECGFLSCPEEEKKLSDGEYQQLIAEALTEGVNLYFEE